MRPSEVEGAFLRAIWSKPKDTAPRLVYADWLDERGQAWEAEAVRYFCSLKEPERIFLRGLVITFPLAKSRKQFSKELVFGALNEHLLALHGQRFRWMSRLTGHARNWIEEG
jgi:uncharacterized protein (TIGR02996 family)